MVPTRQIYGLICLFLFFWLPPVGGHAGNQVMGHEIPPFSMHNQTSGRVEGFSADLFRAAFNQLQSAEVQPVSLSRLLTQLRYEKRQIGLVIGRTKEREDYIKWVGPYLSLNLGIIAKKGRNLKINSVSDLSSYTIATLKNSVPERALLAMGVSEKNFNQDSVPARNILKIQYDRVDLMAYPLPAAGYLMRQNNIDPSLYEDVFPIRETALYFAFSRDFDDREIAQYQQALDDFLKTDAFEKLKAKYSLDAIPAFKNSK